MSADVFYQTLPSPRFGGFLGLSREANWACVWVVIFCWYSRLEFSLDWHWRRGKGGAA